MSSDRAARMALSPIEAIPEVPFYIRMTGPTRPHCTLKHGDTFVVLDNYGDIGASTGGPDGLFHADTRFLSRLELLLDGTQPLLLGSNLRDDNVSLSVDLTNADIYVDDRQVLPKDTLHIVRTFFLWNGTAYQRVGMHNHGDRPVDVTLSMLFDSDFADLFEVRGMRRKRRGIAESELLGSNEVVLGYQGLDGKSRRTTLLFDPQPTRLAVTSAAYQLHLAPGEGRSMFVAVGCDRPPESRPVPFFRGLLSVRRERQASTRGATSVETSNPIFNEILCRSMADLYMLTTETPQGPYPYAGTPWYSTTFGRDGLITALQMLWLDPRIARGVLRRLAAYQAKADDPRADAQPGKILHEMRGGEMAALHEVPFGLYYGSVDATPLFVLLAGLYVERTGDDETLAELWPAVEAALRWIDGPGDPDQDGFVEYRCASAQGLANQGWKDSYDAIFHADGRPAEGLYRARGGPRLRVRRQASGGALRPADGHGGAGAGARSRGAPSSRSGSRRRSGAPRSRPMRLRSTARSSHAPSAPRMPGKSCSPACRARTGPTKWRTA